MIRDAGENRCAMIRSLVPRTNPLAKGLGKVCVESEPIARCRSDRRQRYGALRAVRHEDALPYRLRVTPCFQSLRPLSHRRIADTASHEIPVPSGRSIVGERERGEGRSGGDLSGVAKRVHGVHTASPVFSYPPRTFRLVCPCVGARVWRT